VPGIGLRFSRGGSTVNIIYPDRYDRRGNFSLEGSRFTLEIKDRSHNRQRYAGGG
jgi:hypothetical protein